MEAILDIDFIWSMQQINHEHSGQAVQEIGWAVRRAGFMSKLKYQALLAAQLCVLWVSGKERGEEEKQGDRVLGPCRPSQNTWDSR